MLQYSSVNNGTNELYLLSGLFQYLMVSDINQVCASPLRYDFTILIILSSSTPFATQAPSKASSQAIGSCCSPLNVGKSTNLVSLVLDSVLGTLVPAIVLVNSLKNCFIISLKSSSSSSSSSSSLLITLVFFEEYHFSLLSTIFRVSCLSEVGLLDLIGFHTKPLIASFLFTSRLVTPALYS